MSCFLLFPTSLSYNARLTPFPVDIRTLLGQRLLLRLAHVHHLHVVPSALGHQHQHQQQGLAGDCR